jgi:hypothetical protein
MQSSLSMLTELLRGAGIETSGRATAVSSVAR